ncbi:MAG: hypothetical protein OEX02_14745, partial [Cyclobacteriaceae bacterium]|nr:hypothetical protein [Cyclobacteriaceae bacterium]
MTLYSLNDHFPTNQCGSKASNLASLLRAGYNVPNGFVIPNEIYKSYFLTGKPIDNSLKSHIASALQKSNAPYYMV